MHLHQHAIQGVGEKAGLVVDVDHNGNPVSRGLGTGRGKPARDLSSSPGHSTASVNWAMSRKVPPLLFQWSSEPGTLIRMIREMNNTMHIIPMRRSVANATVPGKLT